MDEQWEFFPCQIEENFGTVVYDHALQQTINELEIDQSVRFFLKFDSPDEEGMPSDEEHAVATKLESALQSELVNRNGVYTGRLTVDGERVFYSYLDAEESAIAELAKFLSEEFKVTLEFDCRDDPEKNDYWLSLFPSREVWQFMQDLKVIAVLEEEGDELTEARQIDHWAAFADEEARQKYADWLGEKGFKVQQLDEAVSEEGFFEIHFVRDDVPDLPDFTVITLELSCEAEELDGCYDGWETSVVLPAK